MPAASTTVSYGPSGTLEDIVDQAFYGVKQNTQTSAAVIDRILGDEPISLPDEFVTLSNDYRSWVWSYNTLIFSWGTGGRLLMEVL